MSKRDDDEAEGEDPKKQRTDESAPAEPSDEPSDEPPREPPHEPAKADEGESAPTSTAAPPPRGAAWAEPFAKLDALWTRVDQALLTGVLLALIFSLVAWVFLKGLSAPLMEVKPGEEELANATNRAGLVFRGTIGAAILATVAWFATSKLSENIRSAVTVAALVAGAAAAPLWRKAGIEFFDNLQAWLQEGSLLTLVGGLRGIGTRLTLWLALLGASVATASGKHIHIDVIFRLLPPRFRVPAAVINCLAVSAMCLSGSWGFTDHIAIESFGSKADDKPGEKVERIAHHVGEHLFLARKQIGLDLKSFPKVMAGEKYQWMTPRDWNEWLASADLESHFPKEQVTPLYVTAEQLAEPPDVSQNRAALVLHPAGEAQRGMLIHDLALVFPFGLIMIGLRFLLRALLQISGHVSVDPNEAHKEEIGQHQAPPPAKGGA